PGRDRWPRRSCGTGERRKADVAEGVALALGHVAGRRGNRLGFVTFGERETDVRPPRPGQAGLLGLVAALGREPDPTPTGPTSLGAALLRTTSLARQRAAVVVVSDFRGPLDWRRPLVELAGRHDVIAV